MTPARTNWAGNVAFAATAVEFPTSVEQLQGTVSGAPRVRAVGTGHSFNRLADTSGVHVSLAEMPTVLEIDSDQRMVTVAAGMRYGEFVGAVHDAGLALHNMGSLPHISVGGAVATGTHGSGDLLGNLSTAVRALEMVTAQGDVLRLDRDRDADVFGGAVLSLGALGVVTRLTLDVVPAYEMRQFVYDFMPIESVIGHFDEVLSSAYSVSVFTDWREPVHAQVWVKRSADAGDPPQDWLGARLADTPRNPLWRMPALNCTPQLGEPGPWHERLPHFRLGFRPSSGAELQSEYLVDRADATAALRAVHPLRDLIATVIQTSEIRTVAADDLWLSPAYGRDSMALHFTWEPDAAGVEPVVEALEAALAPFAPRPHWSKVYALPADAVARCYDRLDEFVHLADRFDPRGALRNDMLDCVLVRDSAGPA